MVKRLREVCAAKEELGTKGQEKIEENRKKRKPNELSALSTQAMGAMGGYYVDGRGGGI